MSLTPRERYIAIVSNMPLVKADVIVILEGDNLVRIPEGARLYKEGFAPLVVISGGADRADYHSIPASKMLPVLLAEGVPESAILLEEISQHTRGQAEEVIKLALARGWKKILLVASHYHQYRALLTFLKVLQEQKLDRSIVLINAPARELSWFAKEQQEQRANLLDQEFDRIDLYGAKGHMSSWEDALAYLEWEESQLL